MNNTGKHTLIRNQLEDTFRALSVFKKTKPPFKGWIRSIREALSMSGRQLAERIHVQAPRITEMEKAELEGALTLRSLRKAAEALDCELVYALVPKTSLEETLQRQAHLKAARLLDRVSHTMLLEEQSVSREEAEKMLAEKSDDLFRNPPRDLWNDA
jgi:predicted DNA-binding mobile mystery protein A